MCGRVGGCPRLGVVFVAGPPKIPKKLHNVDSLPHPTPYMETLNSKPVSPNPKPYPFLQGRFEETSKPKSRATHLVDGPLSGGLVFRVSGVGFRVPGLGLRVWTLSSNTRTILFKTFNPKSCVSRSPSKGPRGLGLLLMLGWGCNLRVWGSGTPPKPQTLNPEP